MSERRPGWNAHDEVDEAMAALRAMYSGGRPSPSLEARILAGIAGTRQRRRPRGLPGMWAVRWRLDRRPLLFAGLGSAGLVVALLIATLGGALFPPGRASSGRGGLTASVAASADVPASNPPHVQGTCPLTPVTRLAGGVAPEVDVSGLRWRWGSEPWVAERPEKVVWLTDSGAQPDPGISVYGVRLDLPILIGSRPVTFTGNTDRTVYAAAVDRGWVDLLQLPEPGCWLLTAVWPAGASSVVVAVAPAADSTAPAPPAPTATVPATPLTACPASSADIVPAPQAWPGPAYADGPFRWLLPPTQGWKIGGDGDKLVLDSQVGWDIGDMRILAVPLARAGGVGWLDARAVAGDIPRLFGGGTLGFGVTLPARGCWAFTYVGSQATSTIVADLGR